jgi:hypothetical protein
MSMTLMTEVRCEMRFEKCKGGFRIQCCCKDAAGCTDLMRLCQELCDDACSCCCTIKGEQVCKFNLCCDDCQCERVENRCCITCTSRDAKQCQILQACCECLERCCKNGACCYVSFGETCVCCGNCAA